MQIVHDVGRYDQTSIFYITYKMFSDIRLDPILLNWAKMLLITNQNENAAFNIYYDICSFLIGNWSLWARTQIV